MNHISTITIIHAISEKMQYSSKCLSESRIHREQNYNERSEIRTGYHALLDAVVCEFSAVGCLTERQTGQLDNWQLVKCSTICCVDRQ